LEATKRRQDIQQIEADAIAQSHEQPRESRTKDLELLQQSGVTALQHNEDAALV
jgi:hypothetical protein